MTVTLRMSDKDSRVIRDYAKLHGMTVSEFMRRAAMEKIEDEIDLEVALRAQADGVQVLVQNRGKTIPKEKLDRIFERFFRLDESRSSNTGGAGLGLAIAKEIVEQHGGAISAASADGVISFTVSLPQPLPQPKA